MKNKIKFRYKIPFFGRIFRLVDFFKTCFKQTIEMQELINKNQILMQELINKNQILINKNQEMINLNVMKTQEVNNNLGFVQVDLVSKLSEIKRSTTSFVITSKSEVDILYRKLDTNKNRKSARVHFVRCIDVRNTGDMNCGPELYFHEFIENYTCFFHTIENVVFNIIDKNDWVIIGGGGLLNCYPLAQSSINHILQLCDHVIFWSGGHNSHFPLDLNYWKANLEIDYARFYLFACRDWDFNGLRFCPCVSCMMKGLSENYDIVRRIGILEHYEFPIIEFEEFNYERRNNSLHIKALLKFIGSSEVIITNTYHGAYWSMLMGKKVIITNMFSDKFDYFQYAPVRYSGNLEADIEKARNFPDVLSEYRNINIAFKEEILNKIKEAQIY